MKLVNLTPKKLLCVAGLGCPAVFATDRGTVLVVGKVIKPTEVGLADSAIGSGETLIEVPAALFPELREKAEG